MSYFQDMQRVVIDPPITHENYRELLAALPLYEKLNYMAIHCSLSSYLLYPEQNSAIPA